MLFYLSHYRPRIIYERYKILFFITGSLQIRFCFIIECQDICRTKIDPRYCRLLQSDSAKQIGRKTEKKTNMIQGPFQSLNKKKDFFRISLYNIFRFRFISFLLWLGTRQGEGSQPETKEKKKKKIFPNIFSLNIFRFFEIYIFECFRISVVRNMSGRGLST